MTETAKRENVPAPRPSPTAPRTYRFPHFERMTLPNGLRLVVAPVSKLPLVSVTAVVDAGASTEGEGQNGVAALTAQLLLEGAAGLDGAALTERFERIGTSADAHADWDAATVSLTVLGERLPEALSLVRDLLRAPEFPEREVARLKDERLAELLQLRAEPRALADEHFSRAVYAPSARYAAPAGGDAASVRTLTGELVRRFYAQRYRPATTTLVFAGDVSVERAAGLVIELFDDWRGEPMSPNPRAVDASPPTRLARVVAKTDAPQSEVRVGHVGLPRRHPDYFDATVMNAVLGGLFSSRINLNLREAHGYTYGAFSAFEWRRGAGPFTIQTAVKSDVTGAAVREILHEIERMRSEEIGTDELTLATSYLDGVFPIRYETTAAIATALSNLVIHELPEHFYDEYRMRVRSVTTEGVLRAAQQHLHPDQLRIVVVGDPAVVARPLAEIHGAPVEVVTPEGAEVAA
ncbi:MAG TPA: pitrilysin family protein [Gemmatimonadaceae bacterium]|nr:pitrilysin family protein [Gemmatimonadaceae bacterium]